MGKKKKKSTNKGAHKAEKITKNKKENKALETSGATVVTPDVN